MPSKRLFLAVIVLLVIASGITAGDAMSNLEGSWPLDNNARDFSGNNRNGMLIGDAHFITDGVFGEALELDGDGDYVNVDGYKGIMQSPWTIAAWVNTTISGSLDIVSWGAISDG